MAQYVAEGSPAVSIAAGTHITAAPRRLGVLYATATVIHVGLIKADGDACIRKPYRPENVVQALKNRRTDR
jgi:hypothetical protein